MKFKHRKLYAFMSYQVLARKYRPSQFDEVVGQDTVLKSLIYALSSNRVHHAYLFTGTRGIGKTSLARLLAKCLNCGSGVTDKPCGHCHFCQGIANGNMVDLIEIDAASRTKVEDTRELLDQVQYMPTEARFKIYLIDEVHMLSTHSFNALLKTLEEPPAYVKFLLATTDPQKLPITILSRCLQYHLRPISTENLIGQLKLILEKESIGFDQDALLYIAQAASGSLRDALSLLDQAINYANGDIKPAHVIEMLGLIDQQLIFELAQMVIEKNANGALKLTKSLLDEGKSAKKVLDQLAEFWYALSVYQLSSVILYQAYSENKLSQVAKLISPENLQLYYQVAIKSKLDLALVPDDKIALDMALMRMIAFDLDEEKPRLVHNKPTLHGDVSTKNLIVDASSSAALSEKSVVIEKNFKQEEKAEINKSLDSNQQNSSWNELVSRLNVRGMTKQIALNSRCIKKEGNTYYLESKVYSVTDNVKEKIKRVLSESLKQEVNVVFVSDEIDINAEKSKVQPDMHAMDEKKNLTPFEIQQEENQQLFDKGYESLKKSSVVQTIESTFNAKLDQSYVKLDKH
ncbi:DNA polymerase III subunit gamma/tau [Thiotrichales bacterium 19S9-12]|nr:DNA polymerase III subunit gamma/tau [Thiotrichales bacterium 19S9-11]MCF6810826.1 DNA polymerase III subunit gamma/tau [Thiotrichales bacterium 19S9-12]